MDSLKNILKSLFIFLTAIALATTTACAKSDALKTGETQMVTTTQKNKNDFWVCTFQLIWNDLMNNLVKGPVQFEGGNPELANILNKQAFTEDMLSSDSYYKTMGLASKELKKKVEKDIEEKFHEKSDILDRFEFPDKPQPDKYFLYTMLIKKFEFTPAFEELKSQPFNGQGVYKYFGITSASNSRTRENVEVLFWENPKSFAVKLKNDKNEDLILVRTDSDKSFDKLWKDLKAKEKKNDNDTFSSNDKLSVPFIHIDREEEYKVLTGRAIKGTGFVIEKALQTVKFDLDNKGGKLKSEAAMVMKNSIRHDPATARNFYFDKRFVIFMKEDSSEKPYFALLVKNGDFLVKAK